MSGRLQDSTPGNTSTQTVGNDLLWLLLFCFCFVFFKKNPHQIQTLFSSKLPLRQGVFTFQKWSCKSRPHKQSEHLIYWSSRACSIFLCPSPSKSSTSSICPLEPWCGAATVWKEHLQANGCPCRDRSQRAWLSEIKAVNPWAHFKGLCFRLGLYCLTA